MESPVKKLNLTPADKENAPLDADVDTIASQIESQKPDMDTPQTEQKATVAPTIKAEEADEPLLQENPQRFVLFPIKYHEVRDASATRKVPHASTTGLTDYLETDLANVQEARGIILDCRGD